MFYDKDRRHIYALTENYGHKDLLVSNDSGKANSWSELKLYLSINDNFAIDNSISGLIYYSTEEAIYYSNDYGKNFQLLVDSLHGINGLYKKPESNKLYCSTKNKIYEIVVNGNNVHSIKEIKTFDYNESMKLYPMAAGNKWIYHTTGWLADVYIHSIDEIDTTVVVDAVLENGNYHYKVVKNGITNYQRIDTSNGIINIGYKYNEGIDYFLKINLLANIGEFSANGFVSQVTDTIKYYLFDRKRLSRTFEYSSLDISLQEFVEGIGLYREVREFDFGYTVSTLKGCIINGVVYGDTTKVSVENENQTVLDDFLLNQNYPNPFNSMTTISYGVPSNSFVTLKVYDILGREIATLVNEEKQPGNYQVKFDVRTLQAMYLPSGVYFYTLRAGNFIQIRKMVLLK